MSGIHIQGTVLAAKAANAANIAAKAAGVALSALAAISGFGGQNSSLDNTHVRLQDSCIYLTW